MDRDRDRSVRLRPPQAVSRPAAWSEVFRYVRPEGPADGPFTIETGPLGERLVGGMHRTAAALFVGVRCPLEIVIERERTRRDRTIGQAEAQFAVVHRRGGYDLEVDTSALTPDQAADRIVEAVERGLPTRPFAFVE